jgi:hypothetical protein
MNLFQNLRIWNGPNSNIVKSGEKSNENGARIQGRRIYVQIPETPPKPESR